MRVPFRDPSSDRANERERECIFSIRERPSHRVHSVDCEAWLQIPKSAIVPSHRIRLRHNGTRVHLSSPKSNQGMLSHSSYPACKKGSLPFFDASRASRAIASWGPRGLNRNVAILARRASEGIAQSRCASLACASGQYEFAASISQRYDQGRSSGRDLPSWLVICSVTPATVSASAARKMVAVQPQDGERE